jgi:CRISPR-associated protein Csm2
MTVDIKEILKSIREVAPMSNLSPKDFADEGGYADILAGFFVEQDMKQHKDRLKPTQLRKVFHTLKTIERKYKPKGDEEAFIISDVLSLKPELAYAMGRELIPIEFYDLMKNSLTAPKLPKVKDFRRLIEFLTALLAYHKYRKGIKTSSEKGGKE